MEKNLQKVWGIFLVGIVIFLFFCLISYSSKDPTFAFCQLGYPVNTIVENFGGKFGAFFSGFFLFIFGNISYIGLFSIFVIGWVKIWEDIKFSYFEMIGLIGLFFSLVTLTDALRVQFGIFAGPPYTPGGLTGILLNHFITNYFGNNGGLFLMALVSIGFFVAASRILLLPFNEILSSLPHFKFPLIHSSDEKEEENSPKDIQTDKPKLYIEDVPSEKSLDENKEDVKPYIIQEKDTYKKKSTISVKPVITNGKTFILPHLEMLKIGKETEKETKEDLERYAQVIEETMSDFDIEAEVVKINQGPRVTLYELQPAPGIPIGKITKLSDNISMSLKATSIRMVAPLPGKSTIGIEVPNRDISVVYLRETLESPEFQSSDSKLTISIGKNILGKPVISDLKSMPHLLIAGATGSGKTVCINSLITSILFKASPDEVKFLMIDPKMVELTLYNDIPHLILPVITDIKKAVSALKWLIWEMENRYHTFKEFKVRNIDGYNELSDEKLPYIVVVIDELADMMMIARNEIENSIIRLAQLSRAAGIHLILATQRPSVNVITGIIKANLPCRISFQVASKFDSRTILDSIGAEKLLGRGDLLFLSPGKSHPIRAQGCYVSDEELEDITNFLKEQRKPDYQMEILENNQENNETFKSSGDENEDIYSQAVKIVLETRIASISFLQRRLGIGFNRAAKLIEKMEEEGLVGPPREGKPRIILKNFTDYYGQTNITDN
ncbi:MAG: DNA translocase FtsK [Candidatus Omnitrophica bacterium]|jgi:S-DNA-T family DNA segregation ATPase FtsK/SpoIIIE|nr:DNA translocase FtsK [Candidatus Omnitrophota bacterium]